MVLEELCNKEVEELHQFFNDWYNGKNNTDFNRLSRVLGKNFQIISPTSEVTKREDLMNAIRRGYNSKSKLKIWVENVETRNIGQNMYLSIYNEFQAQNNETTKRISSAIFHTNAKCPNSVEWVHVHETWVRD